MIDSAIGCNRCRLWNDETAKTLVNWLACNEWTELTNYKAIASLGGLEPVFKISQSP